MVLNFLSARRTHTRTFKAVITGTWKDTVLSLKISRERAELGGDLAAMPAGISRSGGNLTAAAPNQKPPRLRLRFRNPVMLL